MAEIKKIICDRCKNQISYGFWAKFDVYREFHMFNLASSRKIDLCENCQRSLEKWMKENNT